MRALPQTSKFLKYALIRVKSKFSNLTREAILIELENCGTKRLRYYRDSSYKDIRDEEMFLAIIRNPKLGETDIDLLTLCLARRHYMPFALDSLLTHQHMQEHNIPIIVKAFFNNSVLMAKIAARRYLSLDSISLLLASRSPRVLKQLKSNENIPDHYRAAAALQLLTTTG